MLKSYFWACVAALFYIPSSLTMAGEVLVGCASNFMTPMKEIARSFEADTGHTVKVAYASTGKLYAQIINHGPFELFFSADQERPALLIKRGLAQQSSQTTYAEGVLALWSRRELPRQRLLESDFRKLAMANPDLAPYGKAALQTLDHLGLREDLNNKLVQGENIAQAFQYVYSGSADLGFVALSQIRSLSLDQSYYWQVPQQAHKAIKQDVVLLKTGIDNPVAKEFLAYVGSGKIRSLIMSYGYVINEGNNQ